MTSRLATRKIVACRMSTIYNRVLFLSSSPCLLMLSQAIDNTLKTLALTSTLRVCPPLLERFGPCEDSPIPSQRKYAGMRVAGKIFSADGTKKGLRRTKAFSEAYPAHRKGGREVCRLVPDALVFDGLDLGRQGAGSEHAQFGAKLDAFAEQMLELFLALEVAGFHV